MVRDAHVGFRKHFYKEQRHKSASIQYWIIITAFEPIELEYDRSA